MPAENVPWRAFSMASLSMSVAKIWIVGTILELQGLQALLEQDGQRVGFLAGGAAGIPDAQGIAGRPVLEQLRDRLFLEEVEQPRIAEEIGHADQQFLVEQLDFLRVLLEETNISRQTIELVDAHAAFDAAVDRVFLVAGKVVAGMDAQQHKDLFAARRRVLPRPRRAPRALPGRE